MISAARCAPTPIACTTGRGACCAGRCGPVHVWSSVVSASAVERYEIAGVGETVAVPAGTFQGCVRVRSQLRSGGVEQVAELTYARGVGLVRLETFAVVEGVARPQVRGELESYRVGAK